MTLRFTPYLVMDGNAQEAVQFYEKALDAKVLNIQTYGDLPEDPENPMPEAAKKIVAHAMLKVGEAELVICDTFPGMPYQKGNQVTVMITISSLEKTKQIFEACSRMVR